MRILVTGGSGFLGSAFVRSAQAAGHELAVLSRQGSVDKNSRAPGSVISCLKGSLTAPPWAEIERFKPEACVHAAWIATPGVYLESPENQDWVRWSRDFLTGLPALGVRHVIALGTCIEYQMTGQPLREDTAPIAPTSLYARCKHELHQSLRGGAAWDCGWCEASAEQGGAHSLGGSLAPPERPEPDCVGSHKQQIRPFAAVPSFYPPSTLHPPPPDQSLLTSAATTLTWARIFYPYGEGEHPARLASSLLAKLRAGEPVTLKTPHSVKDYLHADDVASALMRLVERRFRGAVNVGTGNGVTVETIARQLAEMVGRPELVRVPEVTVADPLDFVVADATRLHSLGWRPQVTLAAGLHRLVEARRQ